MCIVNNNHGINKDYSKANNKKEKRNYKIEEDNLIFYNNEGNNEDKLFKNIATVWFDLKFGIAAKDYSDISTMKELKPTEFAVSFYYIVLL